MNITKALKIMLKANVIDQTESRQGAVSQFKQNEEDAALVLSTLEKLVTTEQRLWVAVKPENIAREEEIFNLYFISYLADYCIQNQADEADYTYTQQVIRAAKKARERTIARLYGELSWIDAGREERLAARAVAKDATVIEKAAAKEAAEKAKETAKAAKAAEKAAAKEAAEKAKIAKPAREKGKVGKILARVVELYTTGSNRAATLAAITAEFELKSEVTAVTYFNDALRINKIEKRKEG